MPMILPKSHSPLPTQTHSKDTTFFACEDLPPAWAPLPLLLLLCGHARYWELKPRAGGAARRPPWSVPRSPSTHHRYPNSSPSVSSFPPRHNHSRIMQVTSPSWKQSRSEYFLIQKKGNTNASFVSGTKRFTKAFCCCFLVTGLEFFPVRVNSGLWSFLPCRIVHHFWNSVLFVGKSVLSCKCQSS